MELLSGRMELKVSKFQDEYDDFNKKIGQAETRTNKLEEKADDLRGKLIVAVAIALLIPSSLAFFGQSILSDILSIRELRGKIESLEKRIEAEPGQAISPSTCSPGDETCCSPEGFFSC